MLCYPSTSTLEWIPGSGVTESKVEESAISLGSGDST